MKRPSRTKQIIKELEADGIHDIRDILPGCLRNKTLEWIRKATINGKAERKPAAEKIINAYPYPRYFLDFETIGLARFGKIPVPTKRDAPV